jgi:hypothetical protein
VRRKKLIRVCGGEVEGREEGGRRKEGGGRREEGEGRKEEGGRRKEEGGSGGREEEEKSY